jgi:heme ABC exporter ATP-binding subunit CcmA
MGVVLTTLASLNDVAVSTGPTPILTKVNLEVLAGECVGITGLNGSGKTTLLRVLATLRRPSSGEGEVLGVALGSKRSRTVRPQIGLLGHQPALAPELTLADNLRFHAALRRPAISVESALERVGLSMAATRRASDCSTGMLRRADLARLFLSPNRILLLDEPTDGLDPQARSLVTDLVDACLADGGAAVVVSHDSANLGDRTSRVYRLVDGLLTS